MREPWPLVLILVAACGDTALDEGTAPPSCRNRGDTCGPSGTSACCDSPLVMGGTFYRSYDVASDGQWANMSYPATLSSFRLDRYEVTTGRFREFVNAGRGTQAHPPAPGAGAHPSIPGSGWDPSWGASLAPDTAALVAALKTCGVPQFQAWTDVPADDEALPINCVSWYEAFAFCAWDGGFLPSEAEWEFAAAGGDEQRAYPWSSPPSALDIDCSFANYNAPGGLCAGSINRVGTESPRGDGRWGQADLSGNLFEWTLDEAASWPLYPTTPCNDCASLGSGASRIVRGGDFASVSASLRTAVRFTGTPTDRGWSIGLRCARSP